MQPSYSAIGTACDGISRQMVFKHKQAGMPVTSIDAAVSWYRALDISRTKAGRIDNAATPAREPAQHLDDRPAESAEASKPGDADEHALAFRAARTERERTRADREALELARLRGKLVDADEAARLAFTAFRVVRDYFENIAPRIGAAAHSVARSGGSLFEVEQLIAGEIRTTLSAAASAIERLAREEDDDD